MMKVFIDTDIFVRNLRYRDDKNIIENDRFLDLVKEKNLIGFTSIYNLLELCGILSFNLSPESLLHLYGGFKKRYQLRQILFGTFSDENLIININTVFGQILKKMSFGDALIAACAEYHGGLIEGFVSWNVKHYKGKLDVDVFTPTALLNSFHPEVV
jgi:predicted nucleic acid-binding protein